MSAQRKLSLYSNIISPTTDETGEYLGVELFVGQRGCALNCYNCDVAKLPTDLNKIEPILINEIITQLNSTLTVSSKANLRLGSDGDAFLYPEIIELVTFIQEQFPDVKIQAYTSGVKIDKKVESLLPVFSEIFVPLVAGKEEIFKTLNRPIGRATLKHMIKNLGDLQNVHLIANIFQTETFNFEDELEEWLEVVSLIKPQSVVLTTILKPNFSLGLFPVDELKLHHLAQLINSKKKVKVKVGLVGHWHS